MVAAIAEQAGRFIHAQVNIYRHDLLDLFVADEVQTGFGRTGKMFAVESETEIDEGLRMFEKALEATR